MIFLNLRGRTGNQLFEYAYAREIQQERNEKIIISTSQFGIDQSNFTLDLNQFLLNPNIQFTTKSILPNIMNNNYFFVKLSRKLFPNTTRKFLSKKGMILDFSTKYHFNGVTKPANIYLDGYFQSELYFSKIRSILQKELIPKKLSNSRDFSDLFDKISNSESVCVTIRRGNYISNPKFKKKYYLCDLNYFKKSMDLISNAIKKPTFFIFSDDIDWIQREIKTPFPVFFEKKGFSVSEKLFLMSSCKHFIISNSSFSWWAQFLSKNDQKKVVAPNRWYANSCKNVGIYDMQNWILTEV